MSLRNKSGATLSISGLTEKLENARASCNRALVGEIIEDCDEFIPSKTGALKESAVFASDYENGLVIWDMPYASSVYYSSETGAHDSRESALWFEAAKNENIQRWMDSAAREFKARLI